MVWLSPLCTPGLPRQERGPVIRMTFSCSLCTTLEAQLHRAESEHLVPLKNHQSLPLQLDFNKEILSREELRLAVPNPKPPVRAQPWFLLPVRCSAGT